MEPSICIYGLIDPRNPELVQYVGKAVNPETRLRRHIKYPDNGLVRTWVNTLAAEGLQPNFVEIEKVTEGTWVDREKYWITEWRHRNKGLLNVHPGGNDPHVSPPWNKGRKGTPDVMKQTEKARAARGVGIGKRLMRRTTIWLTDSQVVALTKISNKTGMKQAELIRRFIDAGHRRGLTTQSA
jgi:hypothetical protein